MYIDPEVKFRLTQFINAAEYSGEPYDPNRYKLYLKPFLNALKDRAKPEILTRMEEPVNNRVANMIRQFKVPEGYKLYKHSEYRHRRILDFGVRLRKTGDSNVYVHKLSRAGNRAVLSILGHQNSIVMRNTSSVSGMRYKSPGSSGVSTPTGKEDRDHLHLLANDIIAKRNLAVVARSDSLGASGVTDGDVLSTPSANKSVMYSETTPMSSPGGLKRTNSSKVNSRQSSVNLTPHIDVSSILPPIVVDTSRDIESSEGSSRTRSYTPSKSTTGKPVFSGSSPLNVSRPRSERKSTLLPNLAQEDDIARSVLSMWQTRQDNVASINDHSSDEEDEPGVPITTYFFCCANAICRRKPTIIPIKKFVPDFDDHSDLAPECTDVLEHLKEKHWNILLQAGYNFDTLEHEKNHQRKKLSDTLMI